MKAFIEHIKKHPAMTAVFALVGFLAFYLLLRGKSSTATNPAGQLAQLTLQEQQLQAGVAQSNAQLQAQQQAVNAQLQTQNNSVNAAAQVQNNQTDAALIAALAQNKSQAQAASLSAEVLNNQNSLEAGVANNQIEAELQAVQGQYGVQNNTIAAELAAQENTTGAQVSIAQLQAQLLESEVNSATVLAQQQQNNQFTISQGIINNVDKVNGSQNRVSLLETAAGNLPGSVAAEYGQTASSISSDSFLSGLASTIANFGTKTVSTLFG